MKQYTSISSILANPPFKPELCSPKQLPMSITLKYLSKSSTGITIRESVESSVNGNTRLLQIKDLPKNESEFTVDNLPAINWESNTPPYYIKHKSIIITGRGEPKAYLFEGDESDKVMISSVLISVELSDDKLITPEFLVWYINNATAAHEHFATNSRDMTLPITSIATVKNLPIILLTLEQQQEILDLESCAKQERQVFERMIKLRQEFNRSASEKILQQLTDTNI